MQKQRTKLEKIKSFWEKTSEEIEILSKNLETTALNQGIALFSAVYKPH